MLLSVFQTVEFYVIATVVAAAIIAFITKPNSNSEARQMLLAGNLLYIDNEKAPSIKMEALDNGNVVLSRYGIAGLSMSGAVSLAITIVGFDISIEERITEGIGDDDVINCAEFMLDYIGNERYHVKYNSEKTGRFVAFTFNNRPGYTVQKILDQ